ncbi:hypothetical protein [Bradyrhizobium sp. LHD-71]|uniref:hypothetical protein n=1 Tax=Bradyrhizobium sp. LHD-71 TaxID=3072141 RepID=UPI00280D3DDA|nr:hypothetical protein [Bradyrhizobium sp. LHD-71]MDQ8731387.1 hypothetical protein [Bradyrhizobium sp. LHD-71]
MSSRDAFAKDDCPVEDELLGSLYRASPQGLQELARSVPPETRAMLALFCYRRSHMQDLALAIASTCELRDLTEWGGTLGSTIYAQAQQAARKPVAIEASSRRKVTLSTAPLATFARPVDDLDDDDLGEDIEPVLG